MQPLVSNNLSPAPDYLSRLNPEQREAVETTEGPLLVLAGAGTGKTAVLISRIAHIIFNRRAFPNQILAVTFTNKAAREMKERVGRLLGNDVGSMWIGTFHSISAKILRRHAKVIGFENNFTILDDDDQIRLLKKILKDINLDEKKWTPKTILGVIQSFKDKGLNPDKVDIHAAGNFAEGRIVEIYTEYQRRLKLLNAMDFGDLLLHSLTLFRDHPDVLAEYHRFFRYLLVDEYQDTNVAQYLWLRLLAQSTNNICCVGDDDQSIYSWRGAEVGNILRFEKDYPQAKIVRLERNYRSTQHILAGASGLIANNNQRLGKTLWTESNGGELIKIKHLWDDQEEAKFVANEIEAGRNTLTREKHAFNEFAILVRAGFQTRSFEERFLTLNIPYRVIGGLRFYERAEIRDAIAYIRIMVDHSNDLAFERIINVPKRGIGKSTLEALYRESRSLGISLYAATKKSFEEGSLATKASKELGRLINNFEKWKNLLQSEKHEDVVKMMLEESGYIQMWKDEALKEKSPEAEGRLENLSELIRAIGEFESLEAFLDHISLVMDTDNAANDDQVNIMTLHAAKGLEFNTVFLTGWEEGLFPHQRSLDERGGGLEEERRLAYVGITRARQHLFITHAANRRVYNQWQVSIPSRFLRELPEANIENLPSDLNFSMPSFSRNISTGSTLFSQQAPADVGLKGVQKSGWQIGERIFHKKFGYGRIIRAVSDNLEINFEHTGLKTLKANFVEKA